jgi:hypothetical protein
MQSLQKWLDGHIPIHRSHQLDMPRPSKVWKTCRPLHPPGHWPRSCNLQGQSRLVKQRHLKQRPQSFDCTPWGK